MRRTQRLRTLAVYCGLIGALLLFGALGLGAVSDFWRAYDRCTYATPPATALQTESSLTDSFPTLVPIGYGCTWKAAGGAGTVSATFPNWPLTAAAGGGVATLAAAAFAVGSDRSRDRKVTDRPGR